MNETKRLDLSLFFSGDSLSKKILKKLENIEKVW